MSFLTTVKEKIGEDIYNKLFKEAEREVALAMQMPLENKYSEKQYYHPRYLLRLTLEECKLFEERGLKISPADVINILFKCKILFAVSNENEYDQRSGGKSFVDEYSFVVPWEKRSENLNTLIEEYFDRLETFLKERILVTEISAFRDPEISTPNLPELSTQDFFEDLFKKLDLPFSPFFKGDHLIQKHQSLEPGRKTYTKEDAEKFFLASAIGYTSFGSETYCYLYSISWLRAFFNLLRIAGFIYPGQIDFGQENVPFKAPTSSVFLGTHSLSMFCWEEDKREPWAKTPDGSLFLSFGYRGLSDMWLDRRTFGGIEQLFIENKQIFDELHNPWTTRCLKDIVPTLDILSSATQIPDVGAKILQIYCCLEHLFVPKNVNRDNKKYTVGGINALRPDLLPWFNDLYKVRCMYAHQGFVVRDKETHGLVVTSMKNVMALLIAKSGSNK